ncbi:MAG: hypothetical protein GWO08_06550, partial [Gammaproteobacteria bacterium]|nr:hypothetical protein [Gammaproteobacteria bacterium]
LAFSSKQAGANGWAVGDNGTILRYKQDTGNNILVNGDFSNGASPWWLFVDPSAAASGSVQNGEYAVSITDGSTVDWYIQLLQSNVPIENGKTYTVSFDAYAASPRQIAFYIRKASAPHTLYSGYQTFALTASKQNYSLTFTMNDPTDNIADFSFVLGTSNVDVFFDNVTLTEQSVQTPALLVTPTTLDFGTTQTSLTFQISNSGGGTLTWNVTENPAKPWITSVLPASGSDGATVTVNVDRAQLTGNNDTGTLVVSSNGGTQNITVLISRTGGQATITPDAPATAPAGQEFWVAVVVDHVNDLFGVSLDLDYPTAYLNYVQSEISNPGTGSANLLGSDLLFFDTPDDPNGKVSFGITRKSGQGGISGSGPVVWAKFVSLASTPDLTQVTWSCTNVTANDASGNTMTLTPQSATTTISTGCIVWPGDTNNDGIVNQADVLPVGLHWNKTGPARPNATTQWIGQFCPPWNPQAATY